MDRIVAESLAPFTIFLALMVGFAAVATVLALTGTYAVVSFVAASRAREFAVRAALGADPPQVMRIVLWQALRLTSLGLALGTLVAVTAAPVLQSLPVSVRAPGLAIFAPVAALIGIVGIAAALIPARRAVQTDLMALLCNE